MKLFSPFTTIFQDENNFRIDVRKDNEGNRQIVIVFHCPGDGAWEQFVLNEVGVRSLEEYFKMGH